ncbi:hypothetical protein [Microbacterium rhizomatis]|uniref:Uncharacterized protein n=1 Tax=Microbacterium rhizomatis TaxID=1631477 RepID=A0A5J5J5A7_9MICO|nr:hypothetical protein [Microbacterium rhizomatis]KAA9110165.1 hypothetical protein F6B43_00180 [Microbacterium rhizomatis]
MTVLSVVLIGYLVGVVATWVVLVVLDGDRRSGTPVDDVGIAFICALIWPLVLAGIGVWLVERFARWVADRGHA